MKKRGQVYILGAIIVGIALVTIFTVTNRSQQTELNKNFERLNANYEREAERFINEYIKDNSPAEELDETFPEFTKNFNSFAKEMNPDFGIITTLTYINKQGGKITQVINMLDTPVFATRTSSEIGNIITPSFYYDDDDRSKIISGCFESGGKIKVTGVNMEGIIPTSSDCQGKFSDAERILLMINDVWVMHEVPDGTIPKPGLIVTAKSEERTQIQVFTNDKTSKQVDNSRVHKAGCGGLCTETLDETLCKSDKKKEKCCKLIDDDENDKCGDNQQKCCRVNCKIFKNKESCELQNNDDLEDAYAVKCCFVRDKCENSIWGNNRFTCEGV